MISYLFCPSSVSFSLLKWPQVEAACCVPNLGTGAFGVLQAKGQGSAIQEFRWHRDVVRRRFRCDVRTFIETWGILELLSRWKIPIQLIQESAE